MAEEKRLFCKIGIFRVKFAIEDCMNVGDQVR